VIAALARSGSGGRAWVADGFVSAGVQVDLMPEALLHEALVRELVKVARPRRRWDKRSELRWVQHLILAPW